ncbi:MAG: ABC transporter ATP-binding protein [Nitrospirae bacterium]|nr:ABC transporter ATP-binding protein [Nitrospirota bacterium]
MKEEFRRDLAFIGGYLTRYRILTGGVLVAIFLSSFLDGISMGMLIPILQLVLSPESSSSGALPFLHILNFPAGFDIRMKVLILFSFFCLTVVIKNIFTYLMNVGIITVQNSLTKDLRTELFDMIIEAQISFHDTLKSGAIFNSINNETERIGRYLFYLLQMVVAVVSLLSYMAVLLYVSWEFTLLYFMIIGAVVLPMRFVIRTVQSYGDKQSLYNADFNFHLMEMLTGARVIHLFGRVEHAKAQFSRLAERYRQSLVSVAKYIFAATPFSEIVMVIAISAMFVGSFYLLSERVTALIPQIIAYTFIAFRALRYIGNISSFRTSMSGETPALRYYQRLMEDSAESRQKSGSTRLSSFDRIEFKNVSFTYGDEKQVLRNFNLTIRRGEVTAIVGASGSGKSTIVGLISRLYDPQAGQVLVDGIDLRELDVTVWRKKIGVVSQDVFLFNDTVFNNISFGIPDAPREKVITAAVVANAHEFIETLEQGYDTLLGERGLRLSGGQKQRISIARAVLPDPEILIFDEATSALDTQSEKIIQESIDRLSVNRTVIIIAHRLSTVRHADNIVVIDEGEIVEQGRHEVLMGDSVLYRKYYELQQGHVI